MIERTYGSLLDGAHMAWGSSLFGSLCPVSRRAYRGVVTWRWALASPNHPPRARSLTRVYRV